MLDTEILETLKQIKAESGANEKERILKRNNNEEFIQVLKYLYDPQYVFGLATKKLAKKVNVELKEDCNTIIETFQYLEKNNTGTDFDIFVVQNFIKKIDEKYKEMLIEMFCKKLTIGASEKMLEKVFPKYFKKFEIMAGQPYFDRVDDIIKDDPEILVTQKFDGQRVIIRVEDGEVKLFSRNGKPYLGLNDLEAEAKQLPNGAYDGELLKLVDGSIVNMDNFPEKSFCKKVYCPKNAEELFSETASIINSKEEDKKGIAVFLFDMIPLENFDKKKQDNTPASIRKSKLELLLSTFNFKYIKYAEVLYRGLFDQNLIKQMLDEMIVLGQEGLMINYTTSPYVFKRTNQLIKVKQVYTADVRIIGVEEGTGKNKQSLGAFLIQTPQGILVKVGSGIDDKTRKEVWEHPLEAVGKIIEIAFTTPSTSKDNPNYSLRFPRFIRPRLDKTEENWEEFDKIIKTLEEEKGKK